MEGEQSSDASTKRRRVPFSVGEKRMILNVLNYQLKEMSEDPTAAHYLGECVGKTAEILCISTKSVYCVLRENRKNGTLAPPKKPGPRTGGIMDKMDEKALAALREKVHIIQKTNDASTLAKILDALKEYPDVPKMSVSTFGRVLKYLKIDHTKGTTTKSIINQNQNQFKTTEGER